mgnify:CR=1 FL=1
MIPRIKVSYRFVDLTRALFVNERSHTRRAVLKNRLAAFLGTHEVLLPAFG